MKTLLFMASMNSLLFMTSPHPVMIMILIIIQAVIVCSLSWIYILNSWFSFIMFLIFLGGLMVLFIYITSLASNEKITLPNHKLIMPPSLMFMATVAYLYVNDQNTLFSNKSDMMNPTSTIMNLYSMEPSIMILLTMMYLLLTLIITIKISNKFEAPIKSMSLNK